MTDRHGAAQNRIPTSHQPAAPNGNTCSAVVFDSCIILSRITMNPCVPAGCDLVSSVSNDAGSFLHVIKSSQFHLYSPKSHVPLPQWCLQSVELRPVGPQTDPAQGQRSRTSFKAVDTVIGRREGNPSVGLPLQVQAGIRYEQMSVCVLCRDSSVQRGQRGPSSA